MTAIPKVSLCAATDCGYNRNQQCHAAAIMVGDEHPACDTYVHQPGAHFGADDLVGQIGACKVDHCVHNEQLMCQAPAIDVGVHNDHADCRTFRPRP